MNAFFNYIRDTFETFWANFVEWLVAVFVKPWQLIFGDVDGYRSIINMYIGSFGFWGWFFFVIWLLLNLAVVGGLIFLFILLIRRIVKYGGKNFERTKLVAEIQRLNKELFFAIQEKNEVLKLKAESLGLEDPTLDSDKKSSIVLDTFPKLGAIDLKYKDKDTEFLIPVMDRDITLEQIAVRYRYFAASQLGLFYDIDLVRVLLAAMGTVKIIILEGISGTGKTSLPYSLGKFFLNDVAICSVQPSWRDRTELIGYYNEFTKKFNESEFLRAIYEASYRKDVNIIILDEMNLARIEYYFAEFLSIMEMPNPQEWIVEVTKTTDDMNPSQLVAGKLLIGQNIWFFGTANNDDSTFTITDKVYDRAISITLNERGQLFDAEFTEPLKIPYEHLQRLFDEAETNFPLSKASALKFSKLDEYVVSKFRISFGNRILRQIKTFVPIYVACGGTEIEALDFMFASKILKKFRALNLAFMRDELSALRAHVERTFGKNNFKLSLETIDEFLTRS
ncbi:MAG: hypothetical protein ACOX3C_04140 [Bacilli bacterium]|jgi:hypothetical protein